jgi:uncharacterized protein YukE
MTSDQADALNAILETMDRRLSGFGERFVNVEANMAESASAADRTAENVHRLSDLYLSLNQNLEDVKTLIGNYVEATRERERQSRKTDEEARGLVSYIRKRFPEAGSSNG